MLPPVVPDFDPVQVPPKVALESVTFDGKVSIKGALSVAALATLLVKVSVSVLVPPGAMAVGLNDFVSCGGILTSNAALASLAALPRSVCSVFALMVLV